MRFRSFFIVEEKNLTGEIYFLVKFDSYLSIKKIAFDFFSNNITSSPNLIV